MTMPMPGVTKNPRNHGDDIAELFGAGGPGKILWETADANANALIFVAPEGGATDVPVFIFGDASIENVDLAWFNGVVEPSIVVVNDAKDAYISIDAGDDAVASAKGLYFKAAADEDIELLNLSVTGTPRVFWDESEDRFGFSKGITFGTVTIATTGTLTINAFTLGGVISGNGQKINRIEEFIFDNETAAAYLTMGSSNNANSLTLRSWNAAGALTNRLIITNQLNTVVATWSGISHTGFQISSAGLVEGVGTGANGFKIKNPKNAAATALSGTQLDVEIDIGGTPYYFTVYPTKA